MAECNGIFWDARVFVASPNISEAVCWLQARECKEMNYGQLFVKINWFQDFLFFGGPCCSGKQLTDPAGGRSDLCVCVLQFTHLLVLLVLQALGARRRQARSSTAASA